jgi:hypothetical protein
MSRDYFKELYEDDDDVAREVVPDGGSVSVRLVHMDSTQRRHRKRQPCGARHCGRCTRSTSRPSTWLLF